MKTNHLFLAITLACPLSLTCTPSFDTAMGHKHPLYAHYFELIQKDLCAQKRYNQLAQQYTNVMQQISPHTELTIPKIIHHIWLGSPVPKQYRRFIDSWKAHHPDWEHILWTDESIAQLTLHNQDLYDAAINYGERSDIARYEILYQFGGLYVDTDFECLQPFDQFNYIFDLYTGIELPGMAQFLGHTIIIPNGLIACKAGHPIMQECITALRTQKENDIVKRSGPLLFTRLFLEHAGAHDIALPALFFYPIDKQTKDQESIQTCIQSYTYAIHHWAGSWILKQEAFVPGITLESQQVGNTLRFRIVDTRKP